MKAANNAITKAQFVEILEKEIEEASDDGAEMYKTADEEIKEPKSGKIMNANAKPEPILVDPYELDDTH